MKPTRKERKILREFKELEKTNGRRWWYRIDWEDNKKIEEKLNKEK